MRDTLVDFWYGMPSLARVFVGACFFAILGAFVLGFFGRPGEVVGALVGGIGYAAAGYRYGWFA